MRVFQKMPNRYIDNIQEIVDQIKNADTNLIRLIIKNKSEVKKLKRECHRLRKELIILDPTNIFCETRNTSKFKKDS